MAAKRRRIEAALKAKAALAAVRGDRTTGELAGQFGVHPTQIGQWKRQLLDGVNHYRQRAGEYFGVPGLLGPRTTPPSMDEIA